MNMNNPLGLLFIIVLIGFVLQMLLALRARALNDVETSPSTRRERPAEAVWALTAPLKLELGAARGITAPPTREGRPPEDDERVPRPQRRSRVPAAPLQRAIVLMEILGPPRALHETSLRSTAVQAW